jgi:pantoate kinase
MAEKAVAKAFSPAGISSFFEICDRTGQGRFITELERIGARGGGFAFEKGVLTEVSCKKASKNSVEVFINGRFAPEAETTRTVVEMLLEKSIASNNVTVNHKVEVPIGAGFGTSAGGALTTAMVLSKLLGINLTMMQLARIAHVAEVKCKTGLGTVGPLTLGGCVITVEPGALGYAVIDRIPLAPNYVIVAGVFQPWPTKNILASSEKRRLVNQWGRKTLECILNDPSIENFMHACKEFAYKTGFATPRVKRLIELAEKAGAVGAAQNMVGEAVHALIEKERVRDVVEAFRKELPEEKIFVGNIDFQGARLLVE